MLIYIILLAEANFESFRVIVNDTLVFKSVQKTNEGKYVCEADNEVGASIKKTISLIVYGNSLLFHSQIS